MTVNELIQYLTALKESDSKIGQSPVETKCLFTKEIKSLKLYKNPDTARFHVMLK